MTRSDIDMSIVNGDNRLAEKGRPVVTVRQGQLQGVVVDGVLGLPYVAFKAIPYAAPPIGELRFKDPQPPAPWSGIRDASTYDKDVCAQVGDYPPREIMGGEDCLYLNVYTKSLNATRRPVMMWIHGGAFVAGSGAENFTLPDYLVKEDVVLVTMNYRLGAMGFLNLGDEVASGNQGFKDQVAALKWIQENIAAFGGDPNSVTIFGASAGGVAVHALAMSPMAHGLFHRAIEQSGVATHPWALNQGKVERCIKLAQLLGNTNSTADPKELVQFLRTIPVYQLVESQSRILRADEKQRYCLPFGLTVDTASKNPFFPKPVDEALKDDSRIPVMLGYDSHEFIMFLGDSSPDNLKKMLDRLSTFVKMAAPHVSDEKIPALTDDLKKVYVADPTNPTAEEIVNVCTDLLFVKDINGVARNRSKRENVAPTYLYRFSYVGDEETMTKTIVPNPPPVRGASHVDELTYLFYLPRNKINNKNPPAVGTRDRLTLERMTKMWANFAKTGNPTPCTDEVITTTWKPMTKNESTYFDIGDELKNKVLGRTIEDIIEKYT